MPRTRSETNDIEPLSASDLRLVEDALRRGSLIPEGLRERYEYTIRSGGPRAPRPSVTATRSTIDDTTAGRGLAEAAAAALRSTMFNYDADVFRNGQVFSDNGPISSEHARAISTDFGTYWVDTRNISEDEPVIDMTEIEESIDRGDVIVRENHRVVTTPAGTVWDLRNGNNISPHFDQDALERLNLRRCQCLSCIELERTRERTEREAAEARRRQRAASALVEQAERASENLEDNSEELEENGDEESINYRPYRPSDELLSNAKRGEVMKSLRPFGVELEIQAARTKLVALSRSLPSSVGIQSDGSIAGSGFEIQTPPASGNLAEELIHEVCAEFRKANAKSDKSCGYHVHIGMHEIDTDSGAYNNYEIRVLRGIWKFYMAFEDVIASFMPKGRRNNHYCQQLRSDYHYKEIASAESAEQLERIWYRVSNRTDLHHSKNSRKHNSRYRGINLHTLFSERHIEIRFHSGTVNARKVLEWANLHCKIADMALTTDLDSMTLGEWVGEIDLPKKTDEFFRIMNMAPESEAYFRIRQEKFAEKPKEKVAVASKEAVEAVHNLMTEETE